MDNTDFKITCSVNKAYEYHDLVSHSIKKRIQGMASGTAVDREGERMSRSVIESFKKTIKEGIYLDSGDWSYVPLVSEHRKNGLGEPQWDQVLGHLVDAWVDDEWNLWIEAELDPLNPNATMLYEKLTRDPEEGKPFSGGLSIGGNVLDVGYEWDAELQRSVNTYKSVALREVTLTSAPAYPTRYLAALHKSVNWEKLESNKESTNVKNENVIAEVVKTNVDLEADAQDQIEKSEESEDQVVEDVNKEVEVADQDAVTEQDVEKDQVEEEVSEAVEKSEEQVEDVVEAAEISYVTTDAFETLSATVNELLERMSSLTENVERSINQKGLLVDPTAEVEEAAEEQEEEEVVEEAIEEEIIEQEEEVTDEIIETDPVERSVDVNRLIGALTALEERISNLDKSFSAKIDQLANEEVDKSIVPSRANASTNKMYLENVESEFDELIKTKRGVDAIKAAFEK